MELLRGRVLAVTVRCFRVMLSGLCFLPRYFEEKNYVDEAGKREGSKKFKNVFFKKRQFLGVTWVGRGCFALLIFLKT